MIVDSPRKFILKEISANEACLYNNQWHRTQPDIHYYNVVRCKRHVFYGAFYDNTCYAVGIWSAPISRHWNKLPYLELRRFAISSECPKYTATWMLGKMIKGIRLKFPEVTRLISYQDPVEFTGTIYKAGNWTNDGLAQKPVWNQGRTDDRKVPSTGRKIRWIYNLNGEID